MTPLRCLRFNDTPGVAREIVLLPAVGTSPEDAVAAGIVAVLARLAEPPCLTLVDLPSAGLAERGMLSAVRNQLLEPGAAAGREMWLAGISHGAWLALLLARHTRPGHRQVAGIALIAPWLGTRELHREIEAAGGATAWAQLQAPADADPGGEAAGSVAEERAAWRFLVTATRPPRWLGHGAADRFVAAQRLAARALPPANVVEVPGAHDWRCWLVIWEHFLGWLPR